MIFNLDKAKNLRSETEDVLIVEGYMDVVSVYASGMKNVIANSGTALTEKQINLIWKFFSNPIICLDGDESGQKAALRIAEKLFPLINEKNKIYKNILSKDKFSKQDFKWSLKKLSLILQPFVPAIPFLEWVLSPHHPPTSFLTALKKYIFLAPLGRRSRARCVCAWP